MKISEITGPGFINLSIPNIDKVQKTHDLLNAQVTVVPKFDGVKLTLWRNDKPYSSDYRDNWVVAYKNQILHPEEFVGLTEEFIRNESIGVSQYAVVHNFLRDNHGAYKDIPTEHEFFVEFIIRKPTITRDYDRFHELVLLRAAHSTAIIEGGMIYTNPSNDWVDLSEAMRMVTPQVVFKGSMGSIESFEHGIKSAELMDEFKRRRAAFDYTNPERTMTFIKELFLSLPSVFGGKEEGVVINSGESFFKIIQEDQHDEAIRNEKKSRWRGSVDEEKEYWFEVACLAEQIAEVDGTLQERLQVARKSANEQGILPWHPKKTQGQIRDDLFLSTKHRILAGLKENQNALFLGKIRVLTNAHTSAIQHGLNEFHSVTVALTSGKNMKVPFSLRKKMIESVFPQVDVIEVKSGNLLRAIQKCKRPISAVIAGSDRAEGYRSQLARGSQVVLEMKRDMDSPENVSATKALESREQFMKMTPKQIHPFFDELWKIKA